MRGIVIALVASDKPWKEVTADHKTLSTFIS